MNRNDLIDYCVSVFGFAVAVLSTLQVFPNLAMNYVLVPAVAAASPGDTFYGYVTDPLSLSIDNPVVFGNVVALFVTYYLNFAIILLLFRSLKSFLLSRGYKYKIKATN